MKKQRFPIESDLLELLIAFAETNSLQQLAKVMCRDPSVVSRGLARLAENGDILIKKDRRWSLTPEGEKLIQLTKSYLEDVRAVMAPGAEPESLADLRLPANACLLVINAQLTLQAPNRGLSSNPLAAQNIMTALAVWRDQNLPIIHAKHVSESPESPYFRGAASSSFMPGIEPRGTEFVLEKTRPSAFVETDLEKILDKQDSDTVVIAGFTAHECVDATAKHAVALGLNVWILEDALAQFELTSPSGKVFSASDVQEIVLSGLSAVTRLVTTRQLTT